MKKSLLISLLFFCTLVSCDETTTIVEVEKNKLFAKVIITTLPSYYDPDSNRVIFKETLDFNGELISASITTLEKIIIGNNSIPFEDSYSIDRKNYGVINFNRRPDKFIQPLNNANFVLQTQIGSIEGVIRIPDSIYNIQYSITDTIMMNDSLVVTFDGAADYFVLYYYVYPDSTPYQFPGELVSKTNKFILNGTHFNKKGSLQISAIGMFNGPYLAMLST